MTWTQDYVTSWHSCVYDIDHKSEKFKGFVMHLDLCENPLFDFLIALKHLLVVLLY